MYLNFLKWWKVFRWSSFYTPLNSLPYLTHVCMHPQHMSASVCHHSYSRLWAAVPASAKNQIPQHQGKPIIIPSNLKCRSALDKSLIILLMLPCSNIMVLFLLWNSELTKLHNNVICKQYFHFLCSFQMDIMLGLMHWEDVCFLNNLEWGWYPFRMSNIVSALVIQNYICTNQWIEQGPGMVTSWKFINNILRVHHGLNMNIWELADFQCCLISWIVMCSFHLIYYEN